MTKANSRTPKLAPATRDAARPVKEPPLAQLASFVDLFVWLLVLKSFFLPLFIIPTGSMAETLDGAHADHACPNCGYEYTIGPEPSRDHAYFPPEIRCPNCHWVEDTTRARRDGVTLRRKSGDRIIVHGWPFRFGGMFGPQRWDVVVFKNPNEPDVNYIKRLIGLPGETIEIVDGDIFVTPPGESDPQIVRKSAVARSALWFPFYNHDYLPIEPAERRVRRSRSDSAEYYPRWVSVEPDTPWSELETRTPLFDGADADRAEIAFTTNTEGNLRPPEITDIYGYNSLNAIPSIVTDIRLSTSVRFEAGDGYVELQTSKYDRVFYARLTPAGRLTLELATDNGDRTPLANPIELGPLSPDRSVRLALAHADGEVTAEIDDRVVLRSDPDRYAVTYADAKHFEQISRFSRVRIAAEHVRARLSHMRIDRDVHYGAAVIQEHDPENGGIRTHPGNGVSGNPITLRDDEYFVLGDNSPASQDSRLWTREMLGPHLWDRYEAGEYDLGTVPADQMIGRAFFVYWPGFSPITPTGPNIVPDFGRVRWIH